MGTRGDFGGTPKWTRETVAAPLAWVLPNKRGWNGARGIVTVWASMDRQTLEFYDRTAAETAAKYRAVDQSAWRKLYAEVFPVGGRVLDVGAGSGRDVAMLVAMGFNAWGLEPSEQMRAESERAFPELKGKFLPVGLPLPENAEVGGPFDGVICSAVLMHVPESELFDAAFSLKRVLKEKGRLLISVPATRPGLNVEDRDETGRLFKLLQPEYLTLLFERLGFQLLRRWEDSDGLGRAGVRWNNFLFELDSARGRPLERIETVLNRDRKTATYKLALFRALSELGTMQHHQAEWLPDREVALPLRLIAEKWFRYYWPIFEATEFIPQNNGEQPGCAKPVAFRKQQGEIIEAYRSRGGLSQFLIDAASDALPEAVRKQYEETLRCIGATIKDGPVVYSSGAMFRYDKTRRAMVIAAGAWREFCQLGHWIEPAVLLRWAEETNRMSDGRVTVAEVLNRLVVNPTEERNVGAAKAVFDVMAEKRCVWSDKPLKLSYAVDHVIPFSMWHNNDLWNLLPCDSRVNGNKSDKLPERGLLLQRRDAIVFCWEQVRQRHERRFNHELLNFAGTRRAIGNWQHAAFQRLAEAVEETAIQRGAERWRP
jgi:SAM-dependent methyltransferase